MNCLFHTYSEIIFSRTSFVFRNSVCGLSTPSWKRHSEYAAVKTVNLDFLLTTFRAQCYATQRVTGSKSRSKKVDQEPKPVMKAEKDKFFVVRKGDLVGVYRSLSECQTQICDPPATVYKGCSLPKDTETYLLSSGLKNALYSIRAADLTEGLFGTLVPCPFQQLVPVKGETSTEDLPRKRLLELLGPETGEAPGSTSLSNAPRKHVKLDHHLKTEALISGRSCILEFDGASKGNPGQAGAGVVLRADDGTLICRLREGLGIATNNVAEYRAMILGLRYALEKGFTSIRVMGDSKLVCMQDLNSDADAQANLAVGLADGQVQEEFDN